MEQQRALLLDRERVVGPRLGHTLARGAAEHLAGVVEDEVEVDAGRARAEVHDAADGQLRRALVAVRDAGRLFELAQNLARETRLAHAALADDEHRARPGRRQCLPHELLLVHAVLERVIRVLHAVADHGDARCGLGRGRRDLLLGLLHGALDVVGVARKLVLQLLRGRVDILLDGAQELVVGRGVVGDDKDAVELTQGEAQLHGHVDARLEEHGEDAQPLLALDAAREDLELLGAVDRGEELGRHRHDSRAAAVQRLGDLVVPVAACQWCVACLGTAARRLLHAHRPRSSRRRSRRARRTRARAGSARAARPSPCCARRKR
eukprot:Unigene4718_Nuclearia_a/m.14421 Unigene4718_Nuclearia_a/g.14421  ORF Unigene4718_Nuclearia_a/g.14421 Unigene4718_Nuclearia_a/m.14421 type:complete len:322 (+) Unigene4718_Nuclearia_a:2057-3022(+)